MISINITKRKKKNLGKIALNNVTEETNLVCCSGAGS